MRRGQPDGWNRETASPEASASPRDLLTVFSMRCRPPAPAANRPISAHDDAASATGSIFASFLPSERRAICQVVINLQVEPLLRRWCAQAQRGVSG
jgi:hypothetical protein